MQDKIEIVFRWLKQTLQLDHFISQDPQGIMRQVLTALIVSVDHKSLPLDHSPAAHTRTVVRFEP